MYRSVGVIWLIAFGGGESRPWVLGTLRSSQVRNRGKLVGTSPWCTHTRL